MKSNVKKMREQTSRPISVGEEQSKLREEHAQRPGGRRTLGWRKSKEARREGEVA